MRERGSDYPERDTGCLVVLKCHCDLVQDEATDLVVVVTLVDLLLVRSGLETSRGSGLGPPRRRDEDRGVGGVWTSRSREQKST